MRAEAMAAYTRSVLEPLVAALERQAEQIAELREDRGRLTAERDAAQASYAAILEAQAELSSTATPAPIWHSWWPWLVLLAILVLAFAVGQAMITMSASG